MLPVKLKGHGVKCWGTVDSPYSPVDRIVRMAELERLECCGVVFVTRFQNTLSYVVNLSVAYLLAQSPVDISCVRACGIA